MLNSLQGIVSVLRVSLDAPEPLYSRMRGLPLDSLLCRLNAARGRIPLALNAVVTSETLPYLSELLKIANCLGAAEILLLPSVHDGGFALSDAEFRQLSDWMRLHSRAGCTLAISSLAAGRVQAPFLMGPACDTDPAKYLHITARGTLTANSFREPGIDLAMYQTLARAIAAYRHRNMRSFTKSLRTE